MLLSGKSHGRRSLVGCSPWGCEELDTTEQLHFPLSRTGEGNGNPLQCSCLENARDGGAWWAAVYGVTQSRTPPKRLSSSYNSVERYNFVERYKFAWPFLCKFLSIPLLFTPLSKVLFTLKLSIYLLMYLLSPSTLSLQLMKTLAP